MNRHRKFKTTTPFFRMMVIKTIEGLSYRDVIIRVTDSDFLRNFSRINSGTMMNFAALDMAAKCVLPVTWEKINQILSGYARRGKKISGKKLRLDSTVCESNIHYPADASLCWDGFRVSLAVLCALSQRKLSLPSPSTVSMNKRQHSTK